MEDLGELEPGASRTHKGTEDHPRLTRPTREPGPLGNQGRTGTTGRPTPGHRDTAEDVTGVQETYNELRINLKPT